MLHIQKYLQTGRPSDLKNELDINFKVYNDEYGYNDRIIFKYTMKSPKYHPIVKECRGLILSLVPGHTYEVLSRGFDRFYNYGEGHDYKNFDWDNCIVFNKMDGCLEYDTEIDTLEYGILKIGYIVDNKIECHVKSFDITNNDVVYNIIEGYSNKENIGNWYEIELDNGQKLNVTENHYIYMKKLKCWRKVIDLKEGDEVLIN